MFEIRPDGDAGLDCFSDPKSTQLGVGPNIDLVDFGSGLCIGACRLLGVDNGAEDANGARDGDGDAVGVGVEIVRGVGLC